MLQSGKSGTQTSVKPSISCKFEHLVIHSQYLSEHAFLLMANSAPTEALDEADDAGPTPAHSRPVHGGEGGHAIQGCAGQRSLK